MLKIERRPKPDKEGKLIVASEKSKVSEKALQKDGKEDKENISENDREFSIDTQIEKKPENDSVKSPPENLKETKRRRGRPPVVPPAGQFNIQDWFSYKYFLRSTVSFCIQINARNPFLCVSHS